jgi:hypothetical protein
MAAKQNYRIITTTGIILLLFTTVSLNINAQVTGVSVSPSAHNVGTTLHADITGSLEGSDIVIYKWYSLPANILASNSDHYTIQSSDQGNSIFAAAIVKTSGGSPVDSLSSNPVEVNSFPLASYVAITGTLHAGMTLTGIYDFTDANDDPESGTAFQWFRGTSAGGAGAVAIGANSKYYTLTATDVGSYIGFRVTPASSNGSTPGVPVTSAVWVGRVVANSAPSASSVNITSSDSRNVNSVLTASYTYSDAEGDLESGSIFEWLSSSSATGTYTVIPLETNVSHLVKMSEQARYFKFRVTPKAATGTSTGSTVTSPGYIGPINSAPYVTDVSISGNAIVDQTLTASCHVLDIDNDPRDSVIQWLRGNIPIAGATKKTYKLTTDDVDKYISFSVTPVTLGTAFPNTGATVTVSTATQVTDPSAGNPEVTEICFRGNRQVGETLLGSYVYQDKYKESGSAYIWYINDILVDSGSHASHLEYKIRDIDIDSKIEFAVIPKNSRSVSGTIYKSSALPNFNMTKVTFTEQDPKEILLASPVNGDFKGTGVAGGYFDPYIATSKNSPYIIEYSYQASKTLQCSQKAFISLKVNPVNTFLDGIRNVVFCDNSKTITFIARKVPVTATGKSFSITDPNGDLKILNDSTATFEPDRMKTGNRIDTIYFRYTDGTSPVTIREALIIDHIDNFSLGGINPGDQICKNHAPIALFPKPDGGAFTGPVVHDTLFPALMKNFGDTTIVYKYTTINNCSKSLSVPVTINPYPSPDFVLTDTCIANVKDSIQFVDKSAGSDINSWFWKFSESGSAEPAFSTRKTPASLYKTGGYQKVTLTTTTSKNCSDTKEHIVNLGFRPKARFIWLNECRKQNDSLEIRDASIIYSSPVTSRSWSFDNDALHPTAGIVKYPQGNRDSLMVTLTVNTDFKGCNDIFSQTIHIKPTVRLDQTVNNDTLFDFNSGKQGWIRDYNQDNKWYLGTPNRTKINTAYSGTKSWFTGYDITKRDTAFYSVTSPCFDFTNIRRPMISMMTWKRFDNNRNGATLQYQIGDSTGWKYVGTLEDGIRWFNSALVGRPGSGNIIGWTSETPESGWTDSRHQLDFLENKKDVKFRIVYTSDGTTDHTDGMAFDDIRIGERSRHLLLEHFENMNREESSDATALVDTLANRYDQDVVNIQYHTNFPAVDSFYFDNPADVNSRVLFYGLTRTPYSFIDGGYDKANFAALFDYSLAQLDEKSILRRSLTTAPFTINLTSNIVNNVLSVGGKITALDNVNAENMTLYIAVTEISNSDHTGYNGSKLFLNVFRKFIPNGGGLNFRKVWLKNDEQVIPSMTWAVKGVSDLSKVRVIAFLQNGITKNVYQSTLPVKPGNITGTGEVKAKAAGSFSVYPNPAVNNLTVFFSEPLAGDTELSVYDMQGHPVSLYKAASGISEISIPVLRLKPGIYLIRATQNGKDLGYRKLIVGE